MTNHARTACPTKVQTLHVFLALHASYRIEIEAETGDECYSLNYIITSQICTCLLHYIYARGQFTTVVTVKDTHVCIIMDFQQTCMCVNKISQQVSQSCYQNCTFQRNQTINVGCCCVCVYVCGIVLPDSMEYNNWTLLGDGLMCDCDSVLLFICHQSSVSFDHKTLINMIMLPPVYFTNNQTLNYYYCYRSYRSPSNLLLYLLSPLNPNR